MENNRKSIVWLRQPPNKNGLCGKRENLSLRMCCTTTWMRVTDSATVCWTWSWRRVPTGFKGSTSTRCLNVWLLWMRVMQSMVSWNGCFMNKSTPNTFRIVGDFKIPNERIVKDVYHFRPLMTSEEGWRVTDTKLRKFDEDDGGGSSYIGGNQILSFHNYRNGMQQQWSSMVPGIWQSDRGVQLWKRSGRLPGSNYIRRQAHP